MHDFDMIFGMDWLAQHHAHLDCFECHVLFRPVGEPEYSFRGSLSVCRQPALSFLEARDLVCSGCSAFLACLVSLSIEESADSRAPYDVPIVSEFVDVFLKELPSFSPHRKVNFTIDLVPGTIPISKAPYRLSLVEL